MRGEHDDVVVKDHVFLGSSPHARGTPLERQEGSMTKGIIPACAGNTWLFVFVGGCYWDHPRMRGEHSTLNQLMTRLLGSSPHARGTQPAGRIQHNSKGIIPACAGNTFAHVGGLCYDWDHPRMRGEHPFPKYSITVLPGSSPHARGTLIPFAQVIANVGIIPACAGNTF